MIGAQERADNAKMSFEPSRAALGELGRELLGALGPISTPWPSGWPLHVPDAHGDDIVLRARARDALVTLGVGWTVGGRRVVVEPVLVV